MEKTKLILAILISVILLGLGLAIGYTAMPEKVVTNTNTVDKIVVTQVEYNDSAIKADVAKIQATLDEDTIWETAAEKLATDEWTASKYKDIYNAMNDLNISIDEKSDISKVVIKTGETEIAYDANDVDKQNAEVTQYVKVYYEDLNGDDKKVYLTIETVIEDNEVDSQDITETD